MGKTFKLYKSTNDPVISNYFFRARLSSLSSYLFMYTLHRLTEPLFQFFLQGIFQCFAQYKDQMRYGASLLSLEGTETKRCPEQKIIIIAYAYLY
jgi:hypothetical protein